MRRSKMSKRSSKKLFRRTAGQTRKININPGTARGGIRL